jgi:putative ABC transport system ATP-binding protein
MQLVCKTYKGLLHMISANQLTYQYAGGRSMAYPEISANSGESLLILGQSGCGKTTLLHMLGGLLRPANGSVTIKDTNIATLSDKNLDRFRGQHIGFIFQKSHFVQSLTVKDNILLAPFLAKKVTDTKRLQSLANSLGIDHLLHKLPSQLSQGEQQRVSIARAIIHQPDLVLADEPTSSLDDVNTAMVAALLQQLCHENGAALIIVTHDVRLKNLISNQITLTQ